MRQDNPFGIYLGACEVCDLGHYKRLFVVTQVYFPAGGSQAPPAYSYPGKKVKSSRLEDRLPAHIADPVLSKLLHSEGSLFHILHLQSRPRNFLPLMFYWNAAVPPCHQ